MGLASFNLRRREQKKKTTQSIDYDSLTLNDLKQIAKDKNMEGYSGMKKDSLIAELKRLEVEVEGDK